MSLSDSRKGSRPVQRHKTSPSPGNRDHGPPPRAPHATQSGYAFSGFTPRSLDRLGDHRTVGLPLTARACSVATTAHSASTSKNRRKAARVSLRPKPSVPSVVSPPGTQGAIWSGDQFDIVRYGHDKHPGFIFQDRLQIRLARRSPPDARRFQRCACRASVRSCL